jgi:hypothetical protein
MPSDRPPWTPHPPEKTYLLKKYGITQREWWDLWYAQGGGCAICGKKDRHLQVDHDHRADPKKRTKEHLKWSQRGAVRGEICWVCNTALQAFRDNAEVMRSAAAYIDDPPAWRLWPDEKRET